MVINGGSRSGLASYTGYLGWHLQRRDTNEFIQVREITGVLAMDLTAALDEMAMMGAGSRSKRPLYHANIDWKHDEHLTAGQKDRAVDRLADELGLTGQPRIVVEHMKQGREHLHVVWLRIDPETGKAISDSHNYRRHEIVARELEREFGLERVQGVHIERDDIKRPVRTPEAYEFAQAARTGVTPAEAKAEITGLWRQADSGRAFADALDDAGWTLAHGDKRDFVVLDAFGETHSLARRVEGVKAAEIRARMVDIDLATLPSVDEARQAIRDRQPTPAPTPHLEGAEIAAPQPEAIQRPSYEAASELPPELDTHFGPAEPEPPYVPNFVMVVDLDAMMEARFGAGPESDPEAGMVIDVEPAPASGQLHDLDENTPQHRQAKPRQVHEPEPDAPRRQEAEHEPAPSAMDNDARRAMEDLARTDPLGMAARHGFHAGDHLKTPEEMRREWAERARSFAPEPEPEPTPEPMPWGRLLRALAEADARQAQGPTPEMGGMNTPAPEPEAAQRPSCEAEPEPATPRRDRLVEIVAAARAKLAGLAERLDVAFGRVRDQFLQQEPAARLAPEKAKGMDDNGAVILEAMKQPAPERRRTAKDMADEIMGPGRSPAGKKPAAEPTPEMQRSIWDDFKRRRMRRPGEEFEP